MAITDHGVLYGALQFYKEARARGIKPIIGIEAYVAQGSRLEQTKSPYHMTLLAKNETGYRNLLTLATRAHLEGYYYKPRMDKELLEEHHEGIIALSGCATSEVSRHLLDGRFEEAVKAARYYQELFGDFYIEMMDHGIEEHAQAHAGADPPLEGDGHPAGGDERHPLRRHARTRTTRTSCSASARTRRSRSRTASRCPATRAPTA